MQDSPTPPDPYTTANAQTQSNLATANANQSINMVNQVNPYGSLTYSMNPPSGGSAATSSPTSSNPFAGTGGMFDSPLGALGAKWVGYQGGGGGGGGPYPGQYTATTSLSAPMQGIFDKSTGLVNSLLGGSAGGALSGKPLDLSYNATTAALDKLNHARLDPQWAQNTDMQESKLAAQGVTPGTPAYDNAMRVFNQGKNDAYNSANLADYQTSANNAAAEYNAPLATLGSVYGVANGSGHPTFASTPTTNIPGTNVAGLVEQNYQQQSQNANAQNGQMAGLIGTGLSVAAAPFTGGASLAGAAGSMGGLFGKGGGGGGVASTMNYGGQSWPAYS